jgi:hypothetical protein
MNNLPRKLTVACSLYLWSVCVCVCVCVCARVRACAVPWTTLQWTKQLQRDPSDVTGGHGRSHGRSGATKEGSRMGAESGHAWLTVTRVVPRGNSATACGRDRGKGRRVPRQGLHFATWQLRPHVPMEGAESALCHQQGTCGLTSKSYGVALGPWYE